MFAVPFGRALCVAISLVCLSAAVQAETFRHFYDQGVAAREAGNLAAAERHLRSALDRAPQNPDAALFLGLTLNGLGRPQEAIALLEPFVRSFPDYVGLDLTLIRALAASGDPDQAEQRIETLLLRFPENIPARALAARIDLYQQRPGAADAKYRRILADAPENRAAMVGAVDAALALQDAALARLRLDRFARAFPDDDAIAIRRQRLAGLQNAITSRETWTFAAGYKLGDFDPDLDRHEGVLDITRDRPTDIYRLRLETESRSGAVDLIADAFLTPWRSDIYLPTFRVGFGPGNAFLPDYRVGAEIDIRVRDTDGFLPVTVIDTGVLLSGLNDGQAERLSLGIVQYFDVGHGSFYGTFRGFLTNDENGNNIFGWVGQADWRLPGGWAVRAGYGVAPEDSEGSTIVIRTAFTAAEVPLAANASLIASFAREEIVDITRRHFVGLTVKYTF